MKAENIRDFYDQPLVVEHYTLAASRIGLWISEEKIFTRVFNRNNRLLELGTGTGRIAIGLHEIGFTHILGVDLSREMIKEARRMASILGYGISFRVADARKLNFDNDLYDGAIFGFNGLMQIPKKENRLQALKEIHRVIKPGAYFVFTTHDRSLQKYKTFWEKEKKRWRNGKQKKEIDEFGDRYEDTPHGNLFIHVPTSDEVRSILKEAGFRIEADTLRSHIADEPMEVREFSDECRFWVAQKPT